jgi:predicted Zn-dependent protease
MKKLIPVLFVFVLMLVSQNLVFSQESFTHPEAKVTITVPGGWVYEINGNSLTMYPQEKELAIGFNIIDATEMEAAAQKAKNDLKIYFPDAKFDTPTESNINGMNAYTVAGATPGGTNFSYTLLVTPVSKIMEIGYVGSKEAVGKYLSDIALIITGIKPAE